MTRKERSRVRYTEREARAVATLLMSVGVVGANALRAYFKIGRKRALELEAMEPNEAEIAFIMKFAKR